MSLHDNSKTFRLPFLSQPKAPAGQTLKPQLIFKINRLLIPFSEAVGSC